MSERPGQFKYLYGPVPSWRLGRSLGIDLIARQNVCSFDCVYCQLGRTQRRTAERRLFVPTDAIEREIARLPDVPIDYATFSGMGEPTLASNLGEAIDAVREALGKPIAVLTNATLMFREDVAEELSRADTVMAKLDAPTSKLFRRMNRPLKKVSFQETLAGIEMFGLVHPEKLVVQMMFCAINEPAAAQMAELARCIRCREVVLNTPLRPSGVEPLSREAMDRIKAHFAGLPVAMVYDAPPVDAQALDRDKTSWRRPEQPAGGGDEP